MLQPFIRSITIMTAFFMFLLSVLGVMELGRSVMVGIHFLEVDHTAVAAEHAEPGHADAKSGATPQNGEVEKLRIANWDTFRDNLLGVDNSGVALESALRALELFLVAPLPYLLMLGLWRYVDAMASDAMATAKVRSELLEFKAFEVALFIAIIAASVVGRALLTKGLTYEIAISASIIIGVLGWYFIQLEKLEPAPIEPAAPEHDTPQPADAPAPAI